MALDFNASRLWFLVTKTSIITTLTTTTTFPWKCVHRQNASNFHSFPILHLWHWQLFICSQNVHEIPRSPFSTRLHFQPHGELIINPARTQVNNNKNTQLGRTKFNRDPAFDYIAPGVRGLVEKVRPNLFGPLSDRYPSFYPRGEVAELPGWIAFDKQVSNHKTNLFV